MNLLINISKNVSTRATFKDINTKQDKSTSLESCTLLIIRNHIRRAAVREYLSHDMSLVLFNGWKVNDDVPLDGDLIA